MNEAPENPSAALALRKRRTTGVILLVIGSVAWLSQAYGWNLGLMTPLLLGLGFLGWAVFGRECALLIPGGILTGLGTGLLVQRYADLGRDFGAGTLLLCFAAGWLLIPLLSWLVFQRRMLWPLWPAAALAFAGLMRFGGPDVRAWFRAVRGYWPAALIVVALFLLVTKPRSKE